MTIGGWALLIMILALAINTLNSIHSRVEEKKAMIKPESDTEPSPSPARNVFSISIFRRIWVAILSVVSSRKLEDFEMTQSFSPDSSEFTIRFFAPRVLLRMKLEFSKPARPSILKVEFILGRENVCHLYGVSYQDTKERAKIRINVGRQVSVDKVVVTLEETLTNVYYRFKVRALSKRYEDVGYFHTALRALSSGLLEHVLQNLKEYCRLAPGNPSAYLLMSQCEEVLDRREEAMGHALLAAIYGCSDEGLAHYRQLYHKNPMLSPDRCRELKDRYRDWDLDPGIGVVALLQEEHNKFGFDMWYLKEVREVLLVRRPAAARMLTAVSFDFSGSEHLLETRLQIVSPDGTAQELSHERFTVGDSSENNIFITTENRLAGTWLLPHLSIGDIIERTHSVLCREYPPSDDGTHSISVITNPNHEYHPTLEGKVTFDAPSDWQLTFKVTNDSSDIVREDTKADSRQTICFSSSRYIPAGNIGFAYGDSYQNTLIACASSAYTWENVASLVMTHNLGDIDPADELPDELINLIAEAPDAESVLEQSFYWIRDQLKYGAIGSALRNIGAAGRAKAIVAAGIADCKDKSYLLNLVCKRLGLESSYVFVSSERGLIIEELPSDQFDHVFVKVNIDGGEIYLDAADRYAPFGSAPPRYQGLKGLEFGASSQIQQIACDSPGMNRLQIVESFDTTDGDWLSGTLSLKASGHTARIIDEQCKITSLQKQSAIQSMQVVLRTLMPSLILTSHERIAQTSESNIFEMQGTHKRCQLSRMKRQLVGTLDWRSYTIPLGIWRTFDLRDLFVFYLPESVFIQTVITGDLLSKLVGFSDFATLSNPYCRIDGHSVRENDCMKVTREISIKTRFVEGRDVSLIPNIMETIEQALQLALVFREY